MKSDNKFIDLINSTKKQLKSFNAYTEQLYDKIIEEDYEKSIDAKLLQEAINLSSKLKFKLDDLRSIELENYE